jgi:hypothetical protein
MITFGEREANQQKTLKETRRKKEIVIDMYNVRNRSGRYNHFKNKNTRRRALYARRSNCFPHRKLWEAIRTCCVH